MTLPPVRVANANCDFCGGKDHPKLKNYEVPDLQIPGSPDDPNLRAERDTMGSGGGGGGVHEGAAPATKGD